MLEDGQLTPIVCPRCGEPSIERFYGPCGACRTQLRAGAQKSGGRGFPPPATEVPTHANVAGVTVAKPGGRGKHPRRRDPSNRYVTLATDGRELLGPGGARVPCAAANATELAAAVRGLIAGQEAEPVVFIHPAAHAVWDLPAYADGTLPAFFAGARAVGKTFIVAGAPAVYYSVPAHTGDFADAGDVDALLAAACAFHQAVGVSYVFSAAATIHRLIKFATTIGPAEPPTLDPPYTPTAYAAPATAWTRPLTGEELAQGWVRAFDRSGSYLAAWRGLYLSDGPWTHSGPVIARPGPENGRPPGYWLIAEAPRAAVAAAAADKGLPDPLNRDGPLWATTPLLQLAVDILGAPVAIDDAWTTDDRCRPLERPAETLAAARETLAGAGPAGRIALDVVKTGYAAAVGWLEYGPRGTDPLHRPHWRHTILDRHVSNTYRALAKAAPAPFALTDVDACLFALPAPDATPPGLRLGTNLGAWKPKGRPVPMTDAGTALAGGGVHALIQLVGDR